MKITKTSFLSLALVCIVSCRTLCLSAQDNRDVFESYRQRLDQKFEDTRNTHDSVFNSYRDSINNRFEHFLKYQWEDASLSIGVPKPVKPTPMPRIDTTPILSSNRIPCVPPNDNIEPDSLTILGGFIIQEVNNSSIHTFDYFGLKCEVPVPLQPTLEIKELSPESLSSAWATLAYGAYDPLLFECLQYKEKLGLSDWGVYQLVVRFADSYFGCASNNEAILFQMYALSQLGFKVRLGIQEGHLINLIAFSQQIFSAPYIDIEGVRFYSLSDNKFNGNINICDFKFPNEQIASLCMNSLPYLPYLPTPARQIRSSTLQSAPLSIEVNKNLINFFDTYPCCSWEIFAAASLSQEVKQQLYPILEKQIAGCSEEAAVSIILNLVQTGFDYKTDTEQFGREKIFFGDEPFYYPYCDCEDRAILFAILVNDLLGLEVVLLDYPSHIATAVCFNEDISGDYFIINGRKFIICDPTYIGAPIGLSMPDMRNIKANVIKVK